MKKSHIVDVSQLEDFAPEILIAGGTNSRGNAKKLFAKVTFHPVEKTIYIVRINEKGTLRDHAYALEYGTFAEALAAYNDETVPAKVDAPPPSIKDVQEAFEEVSRDLFSVLVEDCNDGYRYANDGYRYAMESEKRQRDHAFAALLERFVAGIKADGFVEFAPELPKAQPETMWELLP